MRSIVIVVLFILLSSSTSLHAQPPADIAKLGAAVFSGASRCHPTSADKSPCQLRWDAGYRLTEWNDGRVGFGDLLAFVGKDQVGLAIGHRFPDYKTITGYTVSFTAGPGYGLPFSGNGLGTGHVGAFVMVVVSKQDKQK